MSEQDPTAPQVAQALVSVLATLALLLLFLGLFLPVTTLLVGADYEVTERMATLWQEGIDDGFTDGGGASAVTYGAMMLVVVLSALACGATRVSSSRGSIRPGIGSLRAPLDPNGEPR